MPEVLVLQHADWELPGYFGDLLAEHGVPARTVRPDLGEPLPDWRAADAILAMGGPMSVNDPLPWLDPEQRLIRDAVTAGVPFLGACLGAQLLASAFGAAVYPGPRPEYGMHQIATTPDARLDPLFRQVPARAQVFQWHGETFDLPIDATPLAESRGYANQAFRLGHRAYGLQFHLEVTADLLAKWLAVPACAAEAHDALGPDAEALLAAELNREEIQMLRLARLVFTGWLDLIGR
jgi:GMP synthase (glutamine-hydrolysing)